MNLWKVGQFILNYTAQHPWKCHLHIHRSQNLNIAWSNGWHTVTLIVYSYCSRGSIAQGVPYTATITDLLLFHLSSNHSWFIHWWLEFDPRQRQKNFSYSLCVQTSSGAHPASRTMDTGGPFHEDKARPGRDADHSPYLVSVALQLWRTLAGWAAAAGSRSRLHQTVLGWHVVSTSNPTAAFSAF
jgi:hypothetical protein